ncbi:MAG: hypothetical protein AABX53_01030 [Nanoarchaeota archaeon]
MTSKPTIPFSAWEQCDLRVGKIIEIEDHPKADKLYVMKVDFGELGQRTIVAGLKKVYTKEQLKEKLGIFIVNLEPVVLRGIESEGMTLAAANTDDSIITLLRPSENIELGSKVR